MRLSGAELRDQIVAFLVFLDDAVQRRIPLIAVSAGLDVLRNGWLRLILADEDANGILRRIPRWLAEGEEAGLACILSAATGGASERNGGARSVVPLLVETQLEDLFALYERLTAPAASNDPGPLPSGEAPPLTAIMLVRDQHVATSLQATPEAVRAGSPWVRAMEWTAPCMASAVTAVRSLSRSFESFADIPVKRPELYWAAWLAQVREDRAITLAFAIDILAGITGLVGPAAADLLVMGASAGQGSFEPMAEQEVHGRLAAVRHLTRRVLVPTATGWVVAGPDADTVTLRGPALTLEGAAQAVWGEAWLAWKREQHRVELLQLGWVPVAWATPPSNGHLPETSIPQVDALDRLFREQKIDSHLRDEMAAETESKSGSSQSLHRRVAILGGTASSGKSVIVRRLAARISAGKHPWAVQVIAPLSRELPDRHVAVEAGRHALGMLEGTDHRRRLLVLEDLLPVGQGAADTVLPYLSEALGVSVLGVLQFDMNSSTEWATDTVEVITAVVGKAELRTFVEHMAWAHPDLVDREAGLAEIRRPGARDVGRLVRVMRKFPDPGGLADGVCEAWDRTLQQRFLSLNDSTRRAVATAAAASLARGGVEPDLLAGLTEDEFADFGVERSPSEGLLRINSYQDSTRLLELYLKGDPRARAPGGQSTPLPMLSQLERLVADLLLPMLESALRDGQGGALTQLRGARLYHGRTCADLLSATWASGSLQQWLSQASKLDLASFLLSLTTSLDDHITAAAIRKLTTKISSDPSPMRLHELVVLIQVLRECISTDSLDFSAFADWIYDQVSAILDRGEGTVDERLNFLRRVVWFQDPVLNGLVKERIVKIVDDLDPRQATDYYLVPQVQRLQARATARAQRNAVAAAFSTWPVELEDDVQRLLNYDPPPEVGFHILVALMLLRRYFGKMDATREWWPMLDTFEHRFPRALKASSPRDVTRSFQEVRRNSPMQRHAILKRATGKRDKGYMNALRELMLEAAPIEAVELLRSMQLLYVRAAYLMLHTVDDVPNQELAITLAQRTKGRNDVKAAGMLLSTAQSVEDLYYWAIKERFTSQFGQALGQEWVLDRLLKDPRPSVKYYLVKGLWEAQVPFREKCLETVLDVTVEAISHSQLPWGPQLALQVGLDPETGPRFFDALRDRISAEALLHGMGPWSSPEGQVHFHRLGRALFPQLAFRYARDFDLEVFAERLGNASPIAAAECCREVLRTLSAARSPVTGNMLLAAGDGAAGTPGAWANRLDRAATAEGFAQILNILREVDRPGARQILATYCARMARSADHGGDQDAETRLIRKVRHAMFESPVGATGMLSALEQTGEMGRTVYDHLMAEDLLKHIFNGELQMSQAPSEQYLAARHLATIGIGPESPGSEWMPPAYKVKKQLVPLLASPRAILDILRMMALWDREWTHDIVRLIDYQKLDGRLARGRTADLASAVDLAAALLALDEQPGAKHIVSSLGLLEWEEIVNRIDMQRAVTLLRLVQAVQPQAKAAVASRVNVSIGGLLTQPVVLDDRGMWIDIGHACHAMAMAGVPVQIPDHPPARQPNLAYASALAWGLQRLPHQSWRDKFFESAMRRVLTVGATTPSALICSLASASLAGCLDDLVAVTTNLSPFLRGSFRALADLYEIAESDAKLAAVLHPYQEELGLLLQARHVPGNWDARRLSNSVTRQSLNGPPGGVQ